MQTVSVASALRQQLSQTFEDPTYRPPPLPAVALELSALSGRDDVDTDEIVRVLERDQMLAGAVMRLVGSPLYAGRGTARTLRDAVLRLGIRTVRDTVFEATLRKSVFNLPEYAEVMARIGRHGTATAYIARVVCKYGRVAADQAFLAALLHDIGFAALLFSASGKKPALPGLVELWPEIDALHESASKVVTKLWGLPGDLSVLVGNHHHEHTGNSSRVAAVIKVADHLTIRFGANIVGPPGPDGVPLPACAVTDIEVADSLSLLGLDATALDRIANDAKPILDDVLGE